MDKYKIAQSEFADASEAAKHLKEQLSGVDTALVLYFASTCYPAEAISKAMADTFAGAQTVGCTTSGELFSGLIKQNTVVAMAFGKEVFKYLHVEILENIKEDCTEAIKHAFKAFKVSLGKSMTELDPAKYVGMVLIDGMSGSEEQVNDLLGNRTNVLFVGGSAGDDFKFKHTHLFVNGKTYTNAAVLVLMEPTDGFTILKTQSFVPSDKKLTPTKVDEKRRMVIEFNGKPATKAYAEVLGITTEELAKNLGQYPVGLVFDEENFFVRSPQHIDGTSIAFYCAIKEGLELTVLSSGNIVEATRVDLQKCGDANALVDFCCCLRTLELKRKNQIADYAKVFANIPAIGFSTYGESHIGHINQTSTMLLLK